MFTIVCYVAAIFSDPKTHEEIFRVEKGDLGLIKDAPKAIKQDPLFNLLVGDGSLKVVEKKNLKQLENDPMKGVSAEGKSGKAAESTEKEEKEPEKEPEAGKTANSEKKKEQSGKTGEKTEEKKTEKKS